MSACWYSERTRVSEFLKLFRTRTLELDVENAIVTSEPVCVVGKDRVDLDNYHGREKVNESIVVWTGLVDAIERDKTLLDVVSTAGSPSEAWEIILGMVDDEGSAAAQNKVKREFKELTFRIEKGSIRDYVARAKSLVMKLEQRSVTTSKQEINCRILNDLPSDFDVKKQMFLIIADIESNELVGGLARIEDQRTRNGSTGSTHAPATGVKPRGNGQGRGGLTRGGRGGRDGSGRGKRDGRGHQYHQQ